MSHYLNSGLPEPVANPDGLDAPYWQGLQANKLMIQRCSACQHWQWGLEWICHRCHGFDIAYEEAEPSGAIYRDARVWHPVHLPFKEQGPYIVVLIELSIAENVRIVGNLQGDPTQSAR